MLVTDRLNLGSDEKSTVHGKEFHSFTLLAFQQRMSTSYVTIVIKEVLLVQKNTKFDYDNRKIVS